MATPIADLFRSISDRDPTKTEVTRIQDIAYKLGIRGNDEFILLIIILELHKKDMEQHKEDMEQLPTEVSKSITERLESSFHADNRAQTQIVLNRISEASGSLEDRIGQELDEKLKALCHVLAKQLDQSASQAHLAAMTKVSESLAGLDQKVSERVSRSTIVRWVLGGISCFCLGFVVCALVGVPI